MPTLESEPTPPPLSVLPPVGHAPGWGCWCRPRASGRVALHRTGVLPSGTLALRMRWLGWLAQLMPGRGSIERRPTLEELERAYLLTGLAVIAEQLDELCPSCRAWKGQMAPSHFGSRGCRNTGPSASLRAGGQRRHCTCDGCF